MYKYETSFKFFQQSLIVFLALQRPVSLCAPAEKSPIEHGSVSSLYMWIVIEFLVRVRCLVKLYKFSVKALLSFSRWGNRSSGKQDKAGSAVVWCHTMQKPARVSMVFTWYQDESQNRKWRLWWTISGHPKGNKYQKVHVPRLLAPYRKQTGTEPECPLLL